MQTIEGHAHACVPSVCEDITLIITHITTGLLHLPELNNNFNLLSINRNKEQYSKM